MRLESITIEKYRSITKAHRIGLADMTVIVGPNNEGKSNILRALVTGMIVLTRGRRPVHRGGHATIDFIAPRQAYRYSVDFPLHLQQKEPNGRSVIVLEFQLTAEEVASFRKEIGSNLNGTLPIRIALGADSYVEVRVYKQGPGAKTLNKKSRRIAAFVSERLDFEHIQAVRTARSAERVVADMVSRELRPLENDPGYIAALKRIEKLQRPILDSLSKRLQETLQTFLPEVADVVVRVPTAARSRGLRSCEVVVDDGTATLLEHKGDGVQSLAALAVMRHASESGARGRNLVIAIEEPESHLHPRAIHELRTVLEELSGNHQVVLTTHSPLFVDRNHVARNILVSRQRARPATSIEEIRTILGIRASDNLQHAELVLVLEGEHDRAALQSVLLEASASLRRALRDGTLALDTLGGASNLAYKLGLIRDALCTFHCFLDHDEEAFAAVDRAEAEGLVQPGDVTYATCPGLKESEIEDLYSVDVYKRVLSSSAFGVNLNTPKFRTKKKWSVRLGEVFKQQGKRWDAVVEKRAKKAVATAVASSPANALVAARRSAFDTLVGELEKRLENRVEADRGRAVQPAGSSGP